MTKQTQDINTDEAVTEEGKGLVIITMPDGRVFKAEKIVAVMSGIDAEDMPDMPEELEGEIVAAMGVLVYGNMPVEELMAMEETMDESFSEIKSELMGSHPMNEIIKKIAREIHQELNDGTIDKDSPLLDKETIEKMVERFKEELDSSNSI